MGDATRRPSLQKKLASLNRNPFGAIIYLKIPTKHLKTFVFMLQLPQHFDHFQ